MEYVPQGASRTTSAPSTERTTTFESEVNNGERFQFGKNWKSFLSTLTDAQIRTAQSSLAEMLEIDSLQGKTFLDVGSGSGIFSLAACRLGARVHSFDFDPVSVACTKQLRARFCSDEIPWTIDEGSILDDEFVRRLGQFDVVYAWGVLSATGEMWRALENVTRLVKTGGVLFVAVYNDQGRKSIVWTRVKKLYCSGIIGKALVCLVFLPYYFARALTSSVVKRRNTFRAYQQARGMSMIHDWFDWLGGLPFEVATVHDVFRFYRSRGFVLQNLKTTQVEGNNEFVFRREY